MHNELYDMYIYLNSEPNFELLIIPFNPEHRENYILQRGASTVHFVVTL